MASYSDAFDTLADGEVWMQAAAVGAGFLAPTVVRNLTEPNMNFDAPDELYGLLLVAGGQWSPMYANEVTLGGAIYTVDKLAERFDLKQSIPGTGGA